MRALTVRQPWAWAIIHGGKDVENRSRNIAGSYRGPVAIHAGKAKDPEAIRHPLIMATWMANKPTYHLDFGAIIGVADLVDVHTIDDCWGKDLRRVHDLYINDRNAFHALPDSGAGGVVGKVRLCSPWAQHDEVHLVLTNPRPLADPIPCRGALGLWTVADDIAARIARGQS